VGGLGCGWPKLNVVFLCRQVRWQNTSFNFAKRWHFRPPFLSVCYRVVGLLGLLVTAYSRYVLAGILHNCGGLALQFGALKKIAPSKTLLRFPSYNGIRFAFCNMFS
jgi:hypothetical protein